MPFIVPLGSSPAAHNGTDKTSFAQRLADLFTDMREDADLADLGRLSVVLYDAGTDLLKTFAHATQGDTPFEFYACRLGDVPSLRELAFAPGPRVVDDMREWGGSDSLHSRRLLECGFRSGLASPLREDDGRLIGFLFMNAAEPGFFTPHRVRRLSAYIRLVELMAVREVERARMIHAAVRTVREISSQRDDETGAHLERMGRYARVIAQELAPRHGLSDEWVEFLAQYAPLHDIGKVAVPDSILFKPGRLTPEEFAVMKRHVRAGEQIVQSLVRNFRLGNVAHVELMVNVVGCHHEGLDGSGYPRGLSGDRIPLEARIVAVADVFDALTSSRPYKRPWSNDEAFAYLQAQAGAKFDPQCVAALLARRAEVEHIQQSFRDAH